jgi:hypothetical protein
VGYLRAKSDLDFIQQFADHVAALWMHEGKAAQQVRDRGEYVSPMDWQPTLQMVASQRDPEYQVARRLVASEMSRAVGITVSLGVPSVMRVDGVPFHLLEAILADPSRGSIQQQTLIDTLHRVIAAADDNAHKELRRAFNPFSWLLRIVTFVLRLPLEVAKLMGADGVKLEREVWPKVLSAVLSAVLIAAALAWLGLQKA